MKVVILTPFGKQRGGGEMMLRQLIQYGRESDIEWTIVAFTEGPLIDEFREMGIRTRVIETGRLRQLHLYVYAVVQLASILREERADLVFSWSGKPHLYGGLAALLAGVPAAWYQLGAPAGMHRSLIDRIATLLPARKVLTLSQAGSRAQAQLWPGRPTELVYPGVELDQFDPEQLDGQKEIRRRLELPIDGPLVGMAGRLQRWKGMHTFVEAMARVLESHPDAHGVIVGGDHHLEPEYAGELRTLISDRGLTDKIVMAGYQSNVSEWMQAMDVVVHASDNEPFGIVVIEAMALEKPVVAGAEGGPREIITEGVNGFLAPFEDSTTLSRRIIRLLDDAALRRRVGKAARQRALEFSSNRYADSFIRAVCALA